VRLNARYWADDRVAFSRLYIESCAQIHNAKNPGSYLFMRGTNDDRLLIGALVEENWDVAMLHRVGVHRFLETLERLNQSSNKHNQLAHILHRESLQRKHEQLYAPRKRL
jgi:hypothetical protein